MSRTAFISTTLVVAGLFLLRTLGEAASAQVFPAGPWWKRWALEFAIFLPPVLLLLSVLPEGAVEQASLWALAAGMVLAMLVQIAWKLLKKEKPE